MLVTPFLKNPELGLSSSSLLDRVLAIPGAEASSEEGFWEQERGQKEQSRVVLDASQKRKVLTQWYHRGPVSGEAQRNWFQPEPLSLWCPDRMDHPTYERWRQALFVEALIEKAILAEVTWKEGPKGYQLILNEERFELGPEGTLEPWKKRLE